VARQIKGLEIWEMLKVTEIWEVVKWQSR